MVVTSAAMATKAGVLVRGEVTRREAAAKGLGVTDTPPLTSPAIEEPAKIPVALYRSEPTFQLPITPCGVLPETGLPSLLKLLGPRTKEPVSEPVIPFSSLRLLGRSPLSESGPPNVFLPVSSPGVVIVPPKVRPPGVMLRSKW
jgi:hypothetical protein